MMMTTSPTVRRSLLSHFSAVSALLLGATMTLVACGGDDDTAEPTGGTGGKSGSGGSSTGGKAGTAGTNTGGASGNNTAGTINTVGGHAGTAGTAGTSAGGAAGNAGTAGTAGSTTGGAAGSTTGGAAGSNIDPMCVGATGTVVKKCKPPTENECAGGHVDGFEDEGANGNGFDDDCDGLVDEGCACDTAGATKDCYAFPSSQTTGAPTWKPVGVCADPNSSSTGKEACTVVGSGEFAKKQYDGNCTAKPPATEDSCDTSKDLNCDGLSGNAPNKCKCNPIVCPADLFTTPFPDPNNIGQFANAPVGPNDPKPVSGIDGVSWFSGNAAITGSAHNWRWTVVGGPCDDTLPNPTFAVFPTNKGSSPALAWDDPTSGHLGAKSLLLPQTPDAKGTDPASPAGTHHGWVLQDDPQNGKVTPSKIYPSFSLSGTYYVTGKFTYNDPNNDNKETEGQCTQLVRVRAPGLRVELCWPEVGHDGGTSGETAVKDNDVDLHVARLQGNPSGDGKHGWFTTSGVAPQSDDCYYSPSSRCGNRVDGPVLTSQTPGWYDDEVTDEVNGVGVCHGWGSRRFASRACTSPRLDRDNISCDKTIEDPNSAEVDLPQQGANYKNFCGPENINLDAKVLTPGQRFAVGVECYNCVGGTNAAPTYSAHPRVNIYCDGELVTGFGYNPAAPAGQTQYPQLITEGGVTNGAFWNVATIEWTGAGKVPCNFTGITAPNYNIDAWHETSDGSASYCVNNAGLNKDGNNQNPGTGPQGAWKFLPDGSYPAAGAEQSLCSY